MRLLARESRHDKQQRRRRRHWQWNYLRLFLSLFRPFRDIPEDVLNTYCWIHSTYTVVDAFMKKQGQEVPFPGVDNSQQRGQLTIKHTKYYQWVAFTLFFQVSRILIFQFSRRPDGPSTKKELARPSMWRRKSPIKKFHSSCPRLVSKSTRNFPPKHKS